MWSGGGRTKTNLCDEIASNSQVMRGEMGDPVAAKIVLGVSGGREVLRKFFEALLVVLALLRFDGMDGARQRGCRRTQRHW